MSQKHPEFTIVIDSDEKKPWVFDNVPTVRRKLAKGDYSIEGYENSISIERKSLTDFVGTILYSYLRFSLEMSAFSQYQSACIVVEASPLDVVKGRHKSGASAHSVLAISLAISNKYGIPVHWWGNRQVAQWMALKWLVHAWERANG
jgi:DNA excision repair protein ERCC-4